MIYIIEIDDRESEVCRNLVPKIFECFNYAEIKKLTWSFLDFNVIGEPDLYLNIDVNKLEDNARRLTKGHIVGWDELIILIEELGQVMDLMLVGDYNVDNIEHKPDEMDCYLNYPVVISNLDGHYWGVSTVYKEAAENIQRVLPYTRLLKDGDKLLVNNKDK